MPSVPPRVFILVTSCPHDHDRFFMRHLFVQSIPKVTGFVGMVKLSCSHEAMREAARILSSWKPARNNPVPSSAFERGDDVRVID